MKNSLRRSMAPLSANMWRWLQAGIIAGTLLVAAVIGLRANNRMVKLMALAPLGFISFILLMRHLAWGLIGLIPISFLVDVSIRTGTNVNLNPTFLFTILLIGTWLFRMVAIDKQVRLAPSRLNLPAIAFIGACTLAWMTSFLPLVPLASEHPSLPAQAGAFLLYALPVALVLLFCNVLENLNQLKIFTWLFIGFGGIYLLLQLILRNYTTINVLFVDIMHANCIFWIWLGAMALGQALFNRNLGRLVRLGLVILAILCFAFNMWIRPQWIAGWSTPIIAVIILLWLRDWRLGLAMTVIGMLIFIPYYTTIYLRVNTDTQQWSTFTRVATWPIVVSLFQINPITGLGPAAYRFYTQLFSYVGYYIPFNTHNNYFDIVLQSGLIGLGAFFWLVVEIFRSGFRLRRKVTDGFSQGYANAVLAGMVATLVSGVMVDWFLPFLYNIGIPGFQASMYTWLFVGGLAGLERILNRAPI
jgi:O-antigen ligase